MIYKILNSEKSSWINTAHICINVFEKPLKNLSVIELEDIDAFYLDLVSYTKNNNIMFTHSSYKRDYIYIPVFKIVSKAPVLDQNFKDFDEKSIFQFFDDFNDKTVQIKKLISKVLKKYSDERNNDPIKECIDFIEAFQKYVVNPFLNSCEINKKIKNKSISIENLREKDFTSANCFACFDGTGWLDKNGSNSDFSDARLFSSHEAAHKRFPKSNVFPIEIKISGTMIPHPKGFSTKNAKDLNTKLQYKDITDSINLKPKEEKTKKLSKI